jgi:hypothetical protein
MIVTCHKVLAEVHWRPTSVVSVGCTLLFVSGETDEKQSNVSQIVDANFETRMLFRHITNCMRQSPS